MRRRTAGALSVAAAALFAASCGIDYGVDVEVPPPYQHPQDAEAGADDEPAGAEPVSVSDEGHGAEDAPRVRPGTGFYAVRGEVVRFRVLFCGSGPERTGHPAVVLSAHGLAADGTTVDVSAFDLDEGQAHSVTVVGDDVLWLSTSEIADSVDAEPLFVVHDDDGIVSAETVFADYRGESSPSVLYPAVLELGCPDDGSDDGSDGS